MSLALRLSGAGMTYVFAIVMARIMTIRDFGLVSSLMSAAVIISATASVGQSVAIVRFVPPLVAHDRHAEARSMMNHAFRLLMASNAIVFALLAGGALAAGELGWLQDAPIIAFGLLLAPLVGVTDHFIFLSRSVNVLSLALVPKDIGWRLISIVILVAIYFASGRREVPSDVALSVLVAVLAGLIVLSSTLLSRWRDVPSLIGMLRKPAFPADAAWLKSRFQLSVVAISQVVYANLDVVVAALVLGTHSAALYFAANRLALVLTVFETSVNLVTSPMISRELAHGNRAELEELAAKAAFQVFVPSLLAGGLMIALAVPVLRLFGGEFVAAEPVLIVLLAGRLLLTLFGPSEVFLIMSDRETDAMNLSIVGIVVGFGVAILAGYLWGAMGIAAGIMAGALLRRMLFSAACYVRLGLRTDILFAVARQWRMRTA
jgi:O-antigen/teichoic acid export membrane protein